MYDYVFEYIIINTYTVKRVFKNSSWLQPWYLYEMVAQNAMRTYELKRFIWLPQDNYWYENQPKISNSGRFMIPFNPLVHERFLDRYFKVLWGVGGKIFGFFFS